MKWLQSDLKNETLYLFPCTAQNRIGLGNDIGMCKIKIKSKHSIKTLIRDLRFPQIAYSKSPNHASPLFLHLMFQQIHHLSLFNALISIPKMGCPLNDHIIHLPFHNHPNEISNQTFFVDETALFFKNCTWRTEYCSLPAQCHFRKIGVALVSTGRSPKVVWEQSKFKKTIIILVRLVLRRNSMLLSLKTGP